MILELLCRRVKMVRLSVDIGVEKDPPSVPPQPLKDVTPNHDFTYKSIMMMMVTALLGVSHWLWL